MVVGASSSQREWWLEQAEIRGCVKFKLDGVREVGRDGSGGDGGGENLRLTAYLRKNK